MEIVGAKTNLRLHKRVFSDLESGRRGQEDAFGWFEEADGTKFVLGMVSSMLSKDQTCDSVLREGEINRLSA